MVNVDTPFGSISEAYSAAKGAVYTQDHAALLKATERVMRQSSSYKANLDGAGTSIHPVTAINGQAIAPIKRTSSTEYSEILASSRNAQAVWSSISLSKRQIFMKLFRDELEKEKESIGFAISADVGKGRKDSEVELGKAMAWLDWAQEPGTAALFAPSYQESHSVKTGVTVQNPAGVVGVMTSFNYPLALSIAGIIPALLTGNSVILKTASKAPHWAFFFQDAFGRAIEKFLQQESRTLNLSDSDARALSGLFSAIHGRDNSLDIDADNLFFVGGTQTGHMLQEKRDAKQVELQALHPESRLTTHLELGGNSVMIVLKSAAEGCDERADKEKKADEIAEIIFKGAYGNSGQRCTGVRQLVLEATHDDREFADLVFVAFTRRVIEDHKIGNPFDEQMLYGALNDPGAAAKIEALTNAATQLGAIRYGGGRLGDNISPRGGIYYAPAVLDWRNVSDNDLRNTSITLGREATSLYEALRHETFGPLVNVVREAKSREEAVGLVTTWDAEKLSAGAVGNSADLQFLQEQLVDAGIVTSLKHNGAPKDPSPKGAHGNAGQTFHTGGDRFYASFTRESRQTGPQAVGTAEKIFDGHTGRVVT